MAKYIDFNLIGELVVHGDVHYEDLKAIPAENVIEINAFRNEVYQYIAANKNEDANFLSGLETAVVIAEKMSGVCEDVDEVTE